MKIHSIVKKKSFVFFVLLILVAALAWAASQLMGQANSLAQDAGANAAEMEILSVNTIKNPVQGAGLCDEASLDSIKNNLNENYRQYQRAMVTARNEMAGGMVSSGTESRVLNLAGDFRRLSDQYASAWGGCGMGARAQLARDIGASRMASAKVIVSEAKESLIVDLNAAQEKIRYSRRQYAQKAVGGLEINQVDKDDLRLNVLPRVQALATKNEGFMNKSEDLSTDLQNSYTGGGSNGGGGGGGGDGHGGGSDGADGVSKVSRANSIIQDFNKSSLDFGRNFQNNVMSHITDINAIINGIMPPAAAASMAKMGGKCFIGASEE